MRLPIKKISRDALFFVAGAAAVLLFLWCAGAAWYTFPWRGTIRIAGFVGYILLFGAAIGLGFRFRKFRYVAGGIALLTILYFASQTPENRFLAVKWQPPWARAVEVKFLKDGRCHLSEIRDFRYRSVDDYDIHYTEMTVDPDGVAAMDLAVSHWDGLQAVAHTMLSFEFDDGRHLAVSMETRLPEGAEQGFLPGLFKQYEIIMLLTKEEDLFKLRTDFRGEEFYLYRTNATREQCRELLMLVLHGAAVLHDSPRFYNSLTTNCTTSLTPLLRWIRPEFKGDLRLLANGYSDELLYEFGYLAHRDGETFAELKARSRVTNSRGAADYSAAIRHRNSIDPAEID